LLAAEKAATTPPGFFKRNCCVESIVDLSPRTRLPGQAKRSGGDRFQPPPSFPPNNQVIRLAQRAALLPR
jgi:hypothetical protein